MVILPGASRFSFRNSIPMPLGQIISAGIIVNGSGVSGTTLRVYGSYALVYLLDGLGQYRDAHGCRKNITPGDAILVFPDLGQTYGPQPGQIWTELNIIFEGDVFDFWRSCGLLDPRQPIHRLDPPAHWQPRLESFVRTVPGTVGGKAQEICRLLSLLTEMLLPAVSSSSEEEWLTQACSLLEASLGNPLPMPQVAAQLGMPYETFRKRFRAEAGLSPARYQAQQRIEAAGELLQYANMPHRQIAEALGFADEYTFAKRFKQFKGITPGAFRRQQHGRMQKATS